jgi:hypothetical protein
MIMGFSQGKAMAGVVAAILIAVGLFGLALYRDGNSDRSFLLILIGVACAVAGTAAILALLMLGMLIVPAE